MWLQLGNSDTLDRRSILVSYTDRRRNIIVKRNEILRSSVLPLVPVLDTSENVHNLPVPS